MSFSGSKKMQELLSTVDKSMFKAKVSELLLSINFKPSGELLNFVSENPLYIKYLSVQAALDNTIPLSVSKSSDGIVKYLISREVAELPDLSMFNPKSTYPSQISDLLRVGGEGLFEYGKKQFDSLSNSCKSIKAYVVQNEDIQNITIIESPLGNVVPVKVLANTLSGVGIKVNVFPISLPRNDRKNRGLTYKEVIARKMGELSYDADLIIYIDDVITGTRFKKIFKELEKELAKASGNALLLPYVLDFPPHLTPQFTWKMKYSNNKSSLRKHLEGYESNPSSAVQKSKANESNMLSF